MNFVQQDYISWRNIFLININLIKKYYLEQKVRLFESEVASNNMTNKYALPHKDDFATENSIEVQVAPKITNFKANISINRTLLS